MEQPPQTALYSIQYIGYVSYVKLIAYAPYNEPWHIQYAICVNSITEAACEKVSFQPGI